MSLAAAVVGTVSRLVGAAADEVAHALRPLPGQVWSSPGWVQVRLAPPADGVPASAIRRRRTAVADAVSARAGVSSVDIDLATGRLLLGHDPAVIPRDEVLAAVAEAESSVAEANEGDRLEFGGRSLDPLVTNAAALALDVVGLCVTTTARVLRVPALPGATSALVALVDAQPRVRQVAERQLGPNGADLAIATASAVVGTLTQSPTTLAVNVLHRCARMEELVVTRSLLGRLGPELAAAGITAEAGRSAPSGTDAGTERRDLLDLVLNGRPVPLPDGPVERLVQRSAKVGLVAGGGTLVATGNPLRAGEAVLAAVPRAARFGRDAFAAATVRRLAGHDIAFLDPGSLRRLDRVDTVLLDARILLGTRIRVLRAENAEGWTHASRLLRDVDPHAPFAPGDVVARRGRYVLRAGPAEGPRAAADPRGLPLVLETGRGRQTLLAGVELSPLVDAVLHTARSVGRVLVTQHASVSEVARHADSVLSLGRDLTEEVWRVQAEGGVVLLACLDSPALAGADVGVGVTDPSGRAPWSADILCGPDLADLWKVLQLPGFAREVSRRSVSLAMSGSMLAGLVAVAGGRSPRLSALLGVSPVNLAAGLAMAQGVLAAARLARMPGPRQVRHGDWHAFAAEDVAEQLHATARQPETLPAPAGESSSTQADWLLRVASMAMGGIRRTSAGVVADLRDPLVPVLVLGAAASAVLGSTIDAALVSGVTAMNAVVSGAQRARAEAVLSRLVARHVPVARIVATDGVHLVPAGMLQPGDVIVVAPADLVPADARLVEAASLEVDEATLTGESLAVEKSVAPTPTFDVAERRCMLFEGTTVVAGTGRAIVVATGDATEAGRADFAAAGPVRPVGVQARLAELTRLALPLTGAGGLGVGLLTLLHGRGAREAVHAGVAVAVAAVPEGLPLVATVAQTAAAHRLAHLGVLVRSSRAVEALGRVDTVCFDKTGTLTEGRLDVRRIVPASEADRDADADVPGGVEVSERSLLLEAALAACPAPDGLVTHATDRAVIAAATAAGATSLPRLAELPFETARGYAAARVSHGEIPVIAVKGAPEIVLDRCQLSEAESARATQAATRMARDGLRVLAVASRPSPLRPKNEGSLRDEDIHDLHLLGFLGLADVPRPSAAPAVRELASRGISVAVVTGDHPLTASAIAAEVGIPTPERVVTGPQLEELGDEEHQRRVLGASVFARVSPEHKVRLVKALQHAGRTVAMTGDGTNDAAAIRAADVGIAVVDRGSAAAEKAADLLLTEADVARISDALTEGRHLWDAVRSAVSVLVGGNAGEVAFTLLGTALGGRAPLSPRQLLLVNLFTDMAPAMALAVRPRNGRADTRRDTRSLWRAIAIRGVATASGATGAWAMGRMSGPRRRAETIGLVALVGTQLGQTLVAGGRDPVVTLTVLGSAGLLAAVVMTPGLGHLFGCVPLDPLGWVIAVDWAVLATVLAWLADRYS